MMSFPRYRLALGAASLALAAGVAAADPIRHPTAIFAGLDKTTGRIINFEVAIDETVQFGALQLTPRVCNTRPQTEAPQTTSFVEVDELILKPDRQGRVEAKIEPAKIDGKQEAKRIFSGWMFAASPGLHGVEHPVYDVWLVDCKGGKETAQPQPAPAAAAAAPASNAAAQPDSGNNRRRSRRVEPEAPAPVENQPIGPADSAPPAPAAEQAAPEAGAADAPVEPGAEPARKKKKRRRAPAAAPAEPAGGGEFLPF
jgi:hypothetical protein